MDSSDDEKSTIRLPGVYLPGPVFGPSSGRRQETDFDHVSGRVPDLPGPAENLRKVSK